MSCNGNCNQGRECGCGRDAPQILKGIGKINGDGWKDTTTKGEVVFVWNAEKPTPHKPGQFPRIGQDSWTASTDQYDFQPATADEAMEFIESRLPRTGTLISDDRLNEIYRQEFGLIDSRLPPQTLAFVRAVLRESGQ